MNNNNLSRSLLISLTLCALSNPVHAGLFSQVASYISSCLYGPAHAAEQTTLARQEELKSQERAAQAAFIHCYSIQGNDCVAPYIKSLEAIHGKQEECTQKLSAIQERKAAHAKYLYLREIGLRSA